MAGSIGLVREGCFKAGENGLSLRTGDAPAWPASEPQLLARVPVAD